uniref:Rho GTPase activating protein 12 n=1 Tax=Takifugu rubripes TaxID=31033 RepID=A0A674PIV2_TAKRU
MADGEGLHLAPGQIYIAVEYDYEYKSKDKVVTIRQGECYMLVKKTNEDWWQVRKEEGTKAFYVPAQYVREVRRALMPPPKPGVKAKPTVLDICRPSDENLNRPQPEMSSFGRPSPSSTPSPPQHCKVVAELVLLHNNNNNQLHSVGASQPSTRTDSPPFRMGDGHSRSTQVDHTSPPRELPGEGLNKSHNDSESGDELSSSSTEQSSPSAHGRSHSPVYTNLQELKVCQSSLPPVPSGSPLHILNDWETHKDLSGRHFYYNRASGERTWKPPRTRDTSSSISSALSSEDNWPSTFSSQSDSQYGSPPRGWSEELDEHGHTLYVSDYTQEKWIKHVDDRGRPYYYSADGSRSEWELPKYISPHSGEVPKTRSLERKQQEPVVLTKWRHSTYLLDVNDKVSVETLERRRCFHGCFYASHRGETFSPDSDSCPSSPKHPSTPSEKCGVLNVTKITENGKKVRKNWTSSWTVLQGSSLLFAKGQSGSTSWKFGSNQSKPEFTVDLRGASAEWASKDKSSKKHVIELKTRQGTELLIQSEIDSVISDWYRALTETINVHVRTFFEEIFVSEYLEESPVVGAHKIWWRNTCTSCASSTVMKPSLSLDSSDQKKTRMKLKKFLIRRPTYQAVRDKGYIKDQVFGSSLTSLCQRENSSVPNFVQMCIDHVEKTGMIVDGLYRVSGNLAVIQKLRFAVNHDEKLDLNDSKWEDIHVTTGALKMFFRELPEPLFTYGFFNDFVDAIKCSDHKQRVNTVKDLIRKLPKPNQDTMQTLFKHLRRVTEHGEANRMTAQSVAIVFGPTLLRPETETGNMAVHMVYQNQIVELVLLEHQTVFGR